MKHHSKVKQKNNVGSQGPLVLKKINEIDKIELSMDHRSSVDFAQHWTVQLYIVTAQLNLNWSWCLI